MHPSSYEAMKQFAASLDSSKPLTILDIGSYDVNGSYRPLFINPNWTYTGLDIAAGPNVDIVVKDLYKWELTQQFDVVISGQCLEHVKDTKEWILQVKQAVKPKGLVCIIAPWQFKEHRYPVDCWRILPDGMRFLLEEVCHFEVLSITKTHIDCIGIAQANE